MVRSTEDKLERHEYRERVLGEQLKKGMVTIDKRIKMLEPLKGTVSRLDERLAAVETILMQNDERERIQLQRTYDIVNDIHQHLPEIVEKLKDEIIQKVKSRTGSDGICLKSFLVVCSSTTRPNYRTANFKKGFQQTGNRFN